MPISGAGMEISVKNKIFHTQEWRIIMKLSIEGIKDKKEWEKAGIKLPSYDVEKVATANKGSTSMGSFWNR